MSIIGQTSKTGKPNNAEEGSQDIDWDSVPEQARGRATDRMKPDGKLVQTSSDPLGSQLPLGEEDSQVQDLEIDQSVPEDVAQVSADVGESQVRPRGEKDKGAKAKSGKSAT